MWNMENKNKNSLTHRSKELNGYQGRERGRNGEILVKRNKVAIMLAEKDQRCVVQA